MLGVMGVILLNFLQVYLFVDMQMLFALPENYMQAVAAPKAATYMQLILGLILPDRQGG